MDGVWYLKTRNVRRFQFVDDSRLANVRGIEVDGSEFDGRPGMGPTYFRDKEGTWKVINSRSLES